MRNFFCTAGLVGQHLVLMLILSCRVASAQFDTVINVPPDIDPGSIDSNTQLNLFDMGELGNGFQAGMNDGSSTNFEVNVFGGVVGDDFVGNGGSIINLFQGDVGSRMSVFDSQVNLLGGTLGSSFEPDFIARSSEVNMDGGNLFSPLILEGSIFNMTGGRIDNSLAINDSTANISGGELFAFSFVTHISVDAGNLNITGGSLIPFGFQSAGIIARNGSCVNFTDGDFATVLGEGAFRIQTNSVMDFTGGRVSGVFAETGGLINFHGGTATGLSGLLGASREGTLLIKSGTIGGKFVEFLNCDLDGLIVIEGGTLDLGTMRCCLNGTINFFGGHVAAGTLLVESSSSGAGVVNIFGGMDLTGDDQGTRCEEEGRITIVGTEFRLLDIVSGNLIQDLTPTMQVGVPVVIPNRDVTLEAQLADGTNFVYDLRSVSAGDFCSPSATLTIELAETTVPESFEVVTGFNASGGLAETLEADDQRLEFNPGFTLNSEAPPVNLVFNGTLPNDNPESLRVMVESSANTPNIEQTVSLFNWTTTEFETIDTRSVSFLDDRRFTIDLTDRISDFVEPVSGRISSAVTGKAAGFTLLFPWTISIDRVGWSTD